MFKTVLMLLIFSTVSTFGLNGTVISSNGTPISNALILESTHNWTKTDDQGYFSLSTQEPTSLTVSALYFETQKDIPITSTEITITLKDDPLLKSDEYHISFDHLRPGDQYSHEELKQDFDVAYSKGFYDGTPESNRTYIDKEVSVDPGGSSLRATFPKDKLKTAESGVDTRIYLSGNYKTGQEYTANELYISYWVKFNTDFNFRCGGKMPSLGGDFANSDTGENERWKGRIMWRNKGSIQFYPELPHSEDTFDSDADRFWGDKEKDEGTICENEFTPYLNDGEWHNIELHYILDNGENSGIFEGWVDGGKGYKIIDSEVFGFYRRIGEGLENLTLNFIMISTFFGGSGEAYYPVRDEYAWFDEFRVSKTRINEYAHYNPINGIITRSSSDDTQHSISSSSNFEESHARENFQESSMYSSPSSIHTISSNSQNYSTNPNDNMDTIISNEDTDSPFENIAPILTPQTLFDNAHTPMQIYRLNGTVLFTRNHVSTKSLPPGIYVVLFQNSPTMHLYHHR